MILTLYGSGPAVEEKPRLTVTETRGKCVLFPADMLWSCQCWVDPWGSAPLGDSLRLVFICSLASWFKLTTGGAVITSALQLGVRGRGGLEEEEGQV